MRVRVCVRAIVCALTAAVVAGLVSVRGAGSTIGRAERFEVCYVCASALGAGYLADQSGRGGAVVVFVCVSSCLVARRVCGCARHTQFESLLVAFASTFLWWWWDAKVRRVCRSECEANGGGKDVVFVVAQVNIVVITSTNMHIHTHARAITRCMSRVYKRRHVCTAVRTRCTTTRNRHNETQEERAHTH